MLDGLHMDLQQIRSKPRDAFDEEISSAEVEGAINEAYEISALGLSGKTITLYNLLFQEVPKNFAAVINQLVFNVELSTHKLIQ